MLALPIDPHLAEIARVVPRSPATILRASPGSGKTTRAPAALLRTVTGSIWVLEPRRLAAKLAALRVAEELGEEVGQTVGYRFRFEAREGPRTRLLFLTEGMFTRRLLSNPRLDGVSVVVLDEFHERHLQGDLALGYLRHLQATTRPDLRLLVMSATLDSDALLEYFGPSPLITVEGRLHPVEIEHLPGPAARPMDEMIARAAAASSGDTLVFLPGMADIRRAESRLAAEAATRGWRVLPLHGDLDRDVQEAVLKPDPGGARRIILSTNLAESSLTLAGITTVIDSGLHRQASFSWWSGLPALRTLPISRASAIQRAGRAGRTGPGRCLRLYSKHEFDSRAPFERPEIQRADLTQAYLELRALGVARPEEFPWLEAPSATQFLSCRDLLARLGALESSDLAAPLTAIGHWMARVPAHPRLARLLIEASRQACVEDAARLAAYLSEGEALPENALDLVGMGAGSRGGPVPEGVRRAQKQLLDAVRPEDAPAESRLAIGAERPRPPDPRAALAFCALAAFPDRVARRRPGMVAMGPRGPETEIVLARGGAIRVPLAGVFTESPYVVVLDARETQHAPTPGRPGQPPPGPRTQVASAVPIAEERLFDLEPEQVRESRTLEWDEKHRRVRELSRMQIGELVLSEGDEHPRELEPASLVLVRDGLRIPGGGPEDWARVEDSRWEAALAPLAEPEALAHWAVRLSLLRKHRGKTLAVPRLAELAAAALHRRVSFGELETEGGVLALLAAQLDPAATAALERDFPTHTMLPRGRRVRIHYPVDRAPWIESRLQDFFGMTRTPALVGGELPLVLHLLAPNQRAVQVTQDLPSFWSRHYPALRKELGRRYPRHAWPEDPLA